MNCLSKKTKQENNFQQIPDNIHYTRIGYGYIYECVFRTARSVAFRGSFGLQALIHHAVRFP
jgi:hypothetical protein